MSNKDKERIEKEADESSGVYGVNNLKGAHRLGYIAGATAERPKAWNEAIDECAATYSNLWINRVVNGLKPTPDEVLKALEKLKHKQP